MILRKINLLLSILFFLISCDFTSGLQKEVLRAQDYIQQQEYEKAAKEYESILNRKLSKELKTKVLFQLGEIYSLYLNKPHKAVTLFSQILELTDDPLWQVKSLEKIGTINFEFIKNYDEAKKAYKTLYEFTPRLEQQDFYYFRYAMAIFEAGNFQESIKHFNKMAKNLGHAYRKEAFFQIGLAHFYMKKWKAAINSWYDYLKYERVKDKIVQTKFLMANAYETNEELKKAYNLYYSILNDYPNPEVIKNRLESLYARRVARKR